jgi:hypothetical protein
MSLAYDLVVYVLEKLVIASVEAYPAGSNGHVVSPMVMNGEGSSIVDYTIIS